MADKSAIEWTDATWNPVTGCTQVSPGCDHCYALTFAERFRGVPDHHFEQGFDLRLWPERLELPLRWKHPRRIFVNSMSDLFHQDVPTEFIQQVFDVMVRANWHVFQVLTKRSGRMARLGQILPWPAHIWAGVSVESNSYAWRVDHLRRVPAEVRFISAEPLLGPVNEVDLRGIDWVIAGGESGAGFRTCDPQWAEDIRDRCVSQRVAFFFKQWGGRTPKAGGRLLDGRTWDEFPAKTEANRVAGRPTSPQQTDFFRELKDWSEIKLRILAKYFDAYQRYRGGSNSVLYYVDGFAGAGYYGDDDGIQKEGSPVRLARLAQDIEEKGKTHRLKCLNFEANRGNFEKLKAAIAGFDSALVQATFGTFEDNLQDVLRTLGQAPALFFLDPFGPSPVKLGNLRPVLRRSDTELLLNLNTVSLRRMAGFEDSDSSSERDAKLRLVSEILGENPNDPEPEWMRQFRSMNAVDWEYWAAQKYMERMRAMSSHIRYTVAYPIRETYRSNPKYFLVFATRATEAVVVMNDLLCTEEDSLFDRSEAMNSDGQLTIFGPLKAAEDGNRLSALLDEIHAYGLVHQDLSRAELINHFVIQKFGQFKKKHYRQAVAKLADEGRARFTNGRPNDKDPIVFL